MVLKQIKMKINGAGSNGHPYEQKKKKSSHIKHKINSRLFSYLNI